VVLSIFKNSLHEKPFSNYYFSLATCAVRRESASSAQLQAVATIVAHEISHQWYIFDPAAQYSDPDPSLIGSPGSGSGSSRNENGKNDQ
jgi:hypothetical protein